jgi:hypothetical protein
MAALAASLAPLRELTDYTSVEKFLQKHYKEMTPADMQKVLDRIAREVEKQYAIRPQVKDYKPMDGAEFVYCLNLTRCIGCRKVRACVRGGEQSITQSRNPIHPRAQDAAWLDGRGERRSLLRAGFRARKGVFLHAGAMPAMQEPAVRQGLPGESDLAGAGWDHRDRLRLVHRLSVL